MTDGLHMSCNSGEDHAEPGRHVLQKLGCSSRSSAKVHGGSLINSQPGRDSSGQP
eukprot:CAMPEP_0177310136 /NCGR_PEP_ID=MMETSP0368-20130122/9680_1 /TAXON_ID=447022 ORGANISM="Scrippsiella hangoei-like, Strain SHHI-4" /NCGR_SAMPLE_ID=MMETSP0368 /ASSEMBLY_ACC=CAM_ASM_000363 /LENGTH=54 /DNA_ID=CAMNT_0018769079 /DNA_START=264 /DNA_END=424 /DNA_ORIENTATION=-